MKPLAFLPTKLCINQISQLFHQLYSHLKKCRKIFNSSLCCCHLFVGFTLRSWFDGFRPLVFYSFPPSWSWRARHAWRFAESPNGGGGLGWSNTQATTFTTTVGWELLGFFWKKKHLTGPTRREWRKFHPQYTNNVKVDWFPHSLLYKGQPGTSEKCGFLGMSDCVFGRERANPWRELEGYLKSLFHIIHVYVIYIYNIYNI